MHGQYGQLALIVVSVLAIAVSVSSAQTGAAAQTAAGATQPATAGTPFWRSAVVEGESLLFVQEGVARPTASLLLLPRKILSLTNSGRDVTYDEGKDYVLSPGSRQIILPEGSRIAFKTAAEMLPPRGSPKSVEIALDGKRSLFFSEGHVFHDLQVVVTYEPAEKWQGFVPAFAGAALPKSMAKLKAGEPLKLVIFGDSISTGANASGVIRVKPMQPGYPQLVRLGLEAAYPAKVTLKNLSVGGKSSPWGVETIAKVSAEEPDLVILAFGMNDAGGITPRAFAENIHKMMFAVQEARPDVEFILVATMLANPEWRSMKAEYFPQYRDGLAKLCGEGVVLADMTTLWHDILKTKKFTDITGNGINHPNDFGQRLYAQVILDLLVPVP